MNITCRVCREGKPEECFDRDGSKKTGRCTICKTCRTEWRKNHPTKRFGDDPLIRLKVRTWEGINSRTINGKYPNWNMPLTVKYYLEKKIELRMGKDEYFSWVEEQRPHIEWLWKCGKRPSIDRKDSSGHYTLENLQIIDTIENITKGLIESNKRFKKKISAKDPHTGKVIYIFESITDVEKMGMCRANVTACLTKRRNTCSGFVWGYI